MATSLNPNAKPFIPTFQSVPQPQQPPRYITYFDETTGQPVVLDLENVFSPPVPAPNDQPQLHPQPQDRSRSSSPPKYPPPSPSTIVPGSIVFLSRQKSTNPMELTCVKTNLPMEEQGYGHPALILSLRRPSPPSSEIRALICTISSNPHPNSRQEEFDTCLPISGYTMEDLNGSEEMRYFESREETTFRREDTLYMERVGMRKQSYVLTGRVFNTLLSYLREWGNPLESRLTAMSWWRVLREVGVHGVEDEWVDTGFYENGEMGEEMVKDRDGWEVEMVEVEKKDKGKRKVCSKVKEVELTFSKGFERQAGRKFW